MNPVGSGPDLNGESALTEDIDHPVVGRHHFGDERPDPVPLGDLGEMGQEGRGYTEALQLVGNHERDLRALGVGSEISGMSHDPSGTSGLHH